METILQLAVLGVGAGAAYVLVAHGIVLIYRGSGTLNFAQGAVAMITAEVFYALKDDHGWNQFLSFATAIALAGGIGLGMHTFVLRPLRKNSALVRLVATLALLTICMGLAMMTWGRKPANVDGLLPADAVRLSDRIVVPADRLYLLGVVCVVTWALSMLYQRTRFGLATSGAAENERAAITLGWSPWLLGGVNWAAGCGLAGLAGILLAPITGLSVTGLTLIVVAGMAAALIGGFSSFWLTMLGGLAIGVAQSFVVRYVSEPGWTDAVPFIAITLLVVIRGQSLPLRGEALERPVRVGTGRPSRFVPVVVVASALVIYLLSNEWTLAVATSLPISIVALSYVVITGYAGQISLAQLTIAGVGAWFAGVASHYWEFPMMVCIALATLTALIVGAVAGLPALRCRGMNLAVVTLGMSVVIEGVVLGNRRWLGGFTGLRISSSDIFGFELSFSDEPKRYTLFLLGAFVLAAIVVANIRRSQSGRQLLAIRSNERAAASLGISVTGGKLFAFSFGSALAGLGGALAAFQFPSINLNGYSTLGSITLLLNSVVGGVGYVFGGVQGGLGAHSGVAAHLISKISDSATEVLIVVSAVLVFLTILTQPDGIASHVSRTVSHVRRRLRRRPVHDSSAVVAAALADTPDRLQAGLALDARSVSVRFGGVQAVHDVNLTVQPGEVLGIIGPNGAGKTTLIDALCGFAKCSGEISLGSTRIDRLSAAERARAGLSRTFQSVELFDDMSVLENIQVATGCDPNRRRRGGYIRDMLWPRKDALPAVAAAAITEFGLTTSLDLLPTELPAGLQRLAGIARALSANPKVICLDEPAAGLSDVEATELAHLVRDVADRWGLSVIVIEHNVGFVRKVSDRVVALDQGITIAEGTPADVLNSPLVIAAYTGEQPTPDDVVAEAVRT